MLFFTHFENSKFGLVCIYQHDPSTTPVIFEVKENLEEIIKLKGEIDQNNKRKKI